MVMQTLLGTVQQYGNASNAAAAHTTKESLAWLPWLCKLYSAPSIWKCQQCSCCAYHKSKPGIYAMVMQTLLGIVQLYGNASNAAAAHTTKESLALLPWSCKLYSAPSIWKCQQRSCCAHHKSLAVLPWLCKLYSAL